VKDDNCSVVMVVIIIVTVVSKVIRYFFLLFVINVIRYDVLSLAASLVTVCAIEILYQARIVPKLCFLQFLFQCLPSVVCDFMCVLQRRV